MIGVICAMAFQHLYRKINGCHEEKILNISFGKELEKSLLS